MNKIDYLRSFIKNDNAVIDRIEKDSTGRDDIQPAVEPETGKFLSFIVRLTDARKVLELGTGIGNSSIWIGEALKKTGGVLYTVDNHPRTRAEAEKNIKDAGLDNNVRIIFGDAEKEIDSLLAAPENAESFDIIFQDCGKYLYPLLHDKILKLVRPGGIIIADDTLFSVCDNIRKNLGRYTDQYNRMILDDEKLYSVILPVGHGLTLSLKL